MNTHDFKSLGDHIASCRKAKGMTQEVLASQLGVTYQAVSKWENGQSYPDVALLPVLADIFEMTMDELFGRALREPRYDLRKGLAAEYLFNGNANDSSGGQKHGRVAGAQLCEDRFGVPNSAYYFDGKADYIIIDPAPPIGSEAFSLSVWCKYAKNKRIDGWHSAIISQDGNLARRVFQLSTFDERMTFHRFLNEPELYANAPLHSEYWYHIVVTYGDHQFKLYRNGMLIHQVEGALRPGEGEPLYIGRKSTNEPYFFFHGVIDDVRIYNCELDEETVNELFLENGWIPQSEPELRIEEKKELPVLDSLSDITVYIAEHEIDAAARWYMEHLGFKLHMEQQNEFYMLTLYNGPELLLCKAGESGIRKDAAACVTYETKRPIEELSVRVAAAGATVQPIRDRGFALYLHFVDPFGYPWTILHMIK